MTAVEYLVQQIFGEHTKAWKEEIKQALEMEKQQHSETFEAGYGAIYPYFEQYYSETYKQSELLNCPYCGSSNIQQKTKSDDECKDCGKTWAV